MLLIEKGLTVVNADFLVLTTVIGEVINMKQGIYFHPLFHKYVLCLYDERVV